MPGVVVIMFKALERGDRKAIRAFCVYTEQRFAPFRQSLAHINVDTCFLCVHSRRKPLNKWQRNLQNHIIDMTTMGRGDTLVVRITIWCDVNVYAVAVVTKQMSIFYANRHTIRARTEKPDHNMLHKHKCSGTSAVMLIHVAVVWKIWKFCVNLRTMFWYENERNENASSSKLWTHQRAEASWRADSRMLKSFLTHSS